ncbi:hypothetical protein SAMN05444392_101767 [Seinonella peptonophila]|uniref:Major Facilitator Superfamily protein n=1 Tax=Seinonella peptonophila TaxID=112248 RepID=A0A1M4U1X8_9BACL|nr:hypothetical protein [Seinonella peptonophila]SHE50739.1 hypothetical protein SAMN05444392_101767 [Seinonella peptonophila]
MLIVALVLNVLQISYNAFFSGPITRAVSSTGNESNVHLIEGGFAIGSIAANLYFATRRKKFSLIGILRFSSLAMIGTTILFGVGLAKMPQWWVLFILRIFSGFVNAITFMSILELIQRGLPKTDNAHRLGLVARNYLGILVSIVIGALGFWFEQNMTVIVWSMVGGFSPFLIFAISFFLNNNEPHERSQGKSRTNNRHGTSNVHWFKLFLITGGIIIPYAVSREIGYIYIPLTVEGMWVSNVMLGVTVGGLIGQSLAALSPPQWNQHVLKLCVALFGCGLFLLMMTHTLVSIFLGLMLTSIGAGLSNIILSETLFLRQTNKSMIVAFNWLANSLGDLLVDFGLGFLVDVVGKQGIWGLLILFLPISTLAIQFGREELKGDGNSYFGWILTFVLCHETWSGRIAHRCWARFNSIS